MPIPKEILAVPRPKNTVVHAYGKNKDHYSVVSRVGCKYQDGRRVPINGVTVGHIIDLTFIPIESNNNVSQCEPDIKDWANIKLCDDVFKNIKNELLKVYSNSDVDKIYCISILRVCYHKIKDYELQGAYKKSFLSELYPDVALSKNTVSSFLNSLGQAYSKIVEYMNIRAENVVFSDHVLVDSTLKSNESKVNSFSDFSRKARLKGSRDISIIYAFDLEQMEPICSKCFPGNRLDVCAYNEFITENKITKGLIVADKGFPESASGGVFKKNQDLHYLNPIKRNSRFISIHSLYEYTEILEDFPNVTAKKAKCSGVNKWLYSYRDAEQAAKEESSWLAKVKKEKKYTVELHNKKQKSFGTIVLESDMDLSLSQIYKTYSKRWEIEIVMRYYKTACGFDETRVHDDYSVIGSEFCDFMSTILTFRIIKAFDKSKLLEKFVYKRLMSILRRAKMIRYADKEWKAVGLLPYEKQILIDLKLLPPEEATTAETDETAKRKRGRPRKTAA